MRFISVLCVLKIPIRIFRNKKRLVKFVLVEEHQILVPCLVLCVQLGNILIAMVAQNALKGNTNPVWNKQPVLIVKRVKFHHMMVLPCANCARTEITKQKKVNLCVKVVKLVDSKKYKYMKVILLITNVLSVQMDVRHRKEPQYVVFVVLDELLKISFVSIVSVDQ